MTEVLILDYNRHDQLYSLLESIKEKSLFDKKVVVLNNGGERYECDIVKAGLVDKVIHNPINIGCGAGTVQLFSQCESDFAFYIQVDHEQELKITEEMVADMKNLILNTKNNFKYIDLAGNQGQGKYSERAQFINKNFYLSIPKSFGGPGPLQDLKWSEESVQDYFTEKGFVFASLMVEGEKGSPSIPFFTDRGYQSTRQNPDGSIWVHATDTKKLKCLKDPTEPHTYPELTEEEWKLAIDGKWPREGKVPEKKLESAFIHWKENELF